MSDWKKSSKQAPCDVCGNDGGWCRITADGARWCGPVLAGGQPLPGGWKILTGADGGRMIRAEGDRKQFDRDAWKKHKDLQRAFEAVKIEEARRRFADALAHEDPDVAIEHLTRRGVPIRKLPAFDKDSEPGKLPPTIVGVRLWDDCVFDDGRREWISLGQWPCVVCAFQDAAGDVTAIQQIFLDAQDPTQARRDRSPRKRQLGVMTGGGAVRLGLIDEGRKDGRLGLCEGVETGLACAAAVGDKLDAVWCCLSTSGLHRPGLSEEAAACLRGVTLLADHDKVNPMTGERSGERAARLAGDEINRAHEHLEIRLAIPTHETAPALIDERGELVAKGA